jgi:hypothetical protein
MRASKNDAVGILQVQRGNLDREYIERWLSLSRSNRNGRLRKSVRNSTHPFFKK